MLIKVCGMRQAQNIAEVAHLAPDLMGFIFWERSPRYAGGLLPEALAALSPATRRVGVFVDATREYILDVARRYRLDFVQLHGDESPALCAELRSDGLGVIKAFGVATAADVARTAAFEGSCDFFLFDTRSAERGGTGRQFDHSLLAAYSGNTPYFLSGGLGADDAEAFAATAASKDTRLAGLDINSRFEVAPGVKNTEAVKNFIETIKNPTL